MAIEFESVKELENWVKRNTALQDGKWVLRDVDTAIRQARREGAAIFNKMRLEAKALGIPDGIIETDLAAFTDDFCMAGQGEVRSTDGTHTLKTFLATEQENRPHWKESPLVVMKTDDKPKAPTPPKSDDISLGRMFEIDMHTPSAAQPCNLAALFET